MSRKRVSDDFWTSNDVLVEPNKKRKTLLTDEDKNLHNTLAWQWAFIVKDGLLQNVKNELLAEYSPTGDYDLLGPPNVNTDLKYFLNQKSMQADQRYVNIQEQITSALIGIGKIIASALICNDSRLIDADILIDVAMLLGNIHHDISLQRRSSIIAAFDLEGITDLSQVNETLFGDKLMKIIKSARVLPDFQAEDDKGKIPLLESTANQSENPEKTLNNSAANKSENPEKNVHDSVANGSKHLEKTLNDSAANRSENPGKNVDDSTANRSENPDKTVNNSATNGSKNPEKTVNDSATNGSKNPEKTVSDSAINGSKNTEKTINDSATNGSKNTEKNVNDSEAKGSGNPEKTVNDSVANRSGNPEKTANDSSANRLGNPEKTVNDSATNISKNPEKTVSNSTANSSENREKNVNAADENLEKKSKSDAEESAKTPSPDNKDPDANKKIETEVNKKSQESRERVERSGENEIGAKRLEAESSKNARLASGTASAAENDLREKTVIGEPSTVGAKSTEKNVDSSEKIERPTSVDNTPRSAKAANPGEEDLPATRTDGTGSQKNGKVLSSEAKCTDEITNSAEINPADKSRSNVDSHNNTETADIIFLEVKNASLRVIEEMDVALKKKLEALKMDDTWVKPEKKDTRGPLPQGDYPGFQQAYKLRLLYEGHCEAAAETMSWSRAKSTMAQYQAPVRHWWKFCKDHNYNVFEGVEQNVTEFFAKYDNLISSSTTLSRWRSALGRFTIADLSKSKAVSDYVDGYKSIKGEKVEKK